MGDLKERIAVLEAKVDGIGARLVSIDASLTGLSQKADDRHDGIVAGISEIQRAAERNGRWTKREIAVILGIASVGGGSGGAILKALSVLLGGQ